MTPIFADAMDEIIRRLWTDNTSSVGLAGDAKGHRRTPALPFSQ
jgi:hypothetical protein